MTASAQVISVNKLTVQDQIIAVMGTTGAGKSSFINMAAHETLPNIVGHTLKSDTSEVVAVRMAYPDNTVVLVDTPGFDDTNRSDFEILKLIDDWIEKVHNKDIKLSGIIYLHPITDTRLGYEALKNLSLFEKICGESSISRVIMATTMWGSLKDHTLEIQRENELHEKYWKGMLAQGSASTRFLNTPESAWSVIDIILQSDTFDALLLEGNFDSDG